VIARDSSTAAVTVKLALAEIEADAAVMVVVPVATL
jgi:hypothetical protein